MTNTAQQNRRTDTRNRLLNRIVHTTRFLRGALTSVAALGVLLLTPVSTAQAQVNIGFGLEFPGGVNPNGVQIGVEILNYPNLVLVPDLPVYYANDVEQNYFYYDGMYWMYVERNWYASSWYNGPWNAVDPYGVPLFLLRVPVRYYRQAPAHFNSRRADAPPRWGIHWGNRWKQRRAGWQRWNRRNTPRAAPLPDYQRRFPGSRYPNSARHRRAIGNVNRHHRPRDRFNRRFDHQFGHNRGRVQTPRVRTNPRPNRSRQTTRRSEQRGSNQRRNVERRRLNQKPRNAPRQERPRRTRKD